MEDRAWRTTSDVVGTMPPRVLLATEREVMLPIAHALADDGYAVSTAEIGSQVVDHLTQQLEAPVDLLVLDGTARPWVAEALADALRRAGWRLPIIFLCVDDAADCDATVVAGFPIDVERIARVARALVPVDVSRCS